MLKATAIGALMLLSLGTKCVPQEDKAVALDVNLYGQVPDPDNLTKGIEKIYQEYGFRIKSKGAPSINFETYDLIFKLQEQPLTQNVHLNLVILILVNKYGQMITYCATAGVASFEYLERSQEELVFGCTEAMAVKAYDIIITERKKT